MKKEESLLSSFSLESWAWAAVFIVRVQRRVCKRHVMLGQYLNGATRIKSQ